MGFFFVSPFAFVCNEMIKKQLNGVSFVKKQNIKEELSEIPIPGNFRITSVI